MKKQILDELNNHFERTRGGLSIVKLSELLKIESSALKKELNELYKEGKIVIRSGVNQKLIYLK
jgi:DNA-binding Lrp family transcriptional regulator